MSNITFLIFAVAMCEHGRGMDGLKVARGRRAAGTVGKRYKQG